MTTASLGCAGLAGLDEFTDPTSGVAGAGGAVDEGAGGSAGSATADAGGGGGGAAGGGEGGGDGGCALVTFDVFAEADTVLHPGECNGANYAGGLPLANLGQGVGLFRFALPPEVTSALEEGRVETLSVVLSRDFDCTGAGEPCPAAPGSLSVRPLRNDWQEGPESFAPYMGSDWCRRGAGSQSMELWQQPGASGPDDAHPESGSSWVDPAQSVVEIDLEPRAHRPLLDASPGFWAISLRIEAQGGAVFVAATHEELEPREPPARLLGAYCVD